MKTHSNVGGAKWDCGVTPSGARPRPLLGGVSSSAHYRRAALCGVKMLISFEAAVMVVFFHLLPAWRLFSGATVLPSGPQEG